MSAAPPTQPPRRRSMRQRTFVDVIMICIVDNRMIIESDHFHYFSAIFHQAFCVSPIMTTMTTSYLEYHQTPVETIAACFHLRSRFWLLVAFSKAQVSQSAHTAIEIFPSFCSTWIWFSVLLHTKTRCVGWRFWPQNQIICWYFGVAVGNYGNAFFWRGSGKGAWTVACQCLLPPRSPSSSRSSGKWS